MLQSMVMSAQTDTELYRVLMPDSYNWKEFHELAMAWGSHASFNFNSIDLRYSDLKASKLYYAAERLKKPEELSDTFRDTLISDLRKNAKAFLKGLIVDGDYLGIQYYAQFAIIKKTNIDEIIEFANAQEQEEIAAYLNEYKVNTLRMKVK